MKDALAILVGKAKPEGGSEKELPASDSLSAAKRIIAAVKSGDASSLDDALQEHYAACEEMHSDEE